MSAARVSEKPRPTAESSCPLACPHGAGVLKNRKNPLDGGFEIFEYPRQIRRSSTMESARAMVPAPSCPNCQGSRGLTVEMSGPVASPQSPADGFFVCERCNLTMRDPAELGPENPQ
jgi:hypothetical protein